MNPKQKLNQFYAQLLATVSHFPDDEDGSISAETNGTRLKPKIDDKLIYMPRDDVLRSGTDDIVVFHPLSEQITRGESEVFKYFKRIALVKLISSFTVLGHGLLQLQDHPVLQRKMTSDQTDIIKGITASDKSSGMNWVKLCLMQLKDAPNRTDTWPIDIHMRRNGKYKDKAYRRVAVVRFPLFERIFAGENIVKDDSTNMFRSKDQKTFQEIAKAIFPTIDDLGSEEYNSGYDDTLGPFTVCFLKSFKKLADRINFVTETMMEHLSTIGVDSKLILIDTEVLKVIDSEDLSELAAAAKSVPALKYNMGVSDQNESDNVPKERTVNGFKVTPVRESEKPVQSAKGESTDRSTEKGSSHVSKKDDNTGLTEAQIAQRDEARRKREEFEKRQKEDREYEAERLRRREERSRDSDRDYRRDDDRDYRDRERTRSRDDDGRERDRRYPEKDDDVVRSSDPNKVSISEILSKSPSVFKGTRTEEEERMREDRRYGRSRRSRYDDRDYDDDDRDYRYRDRDRGRYDDRDYRDRDYRDRDRDYRDRDRDRGYRGRGSDRGYRR